MCVRRVVEIASPGYCRGGPFGAGSDSRLLQQSSPDTVQLMYAANGWEVPSARKVLGGARVRGPASEARHDGNLESPPVEEEL